MGLLYFVPGGDREIGLEELATAGIGYAFERKPVASGCQAGPDGSAGVVVCVDSQVGGRRIGYYPERQKWMQVPATSAWCGVERGMAVDPSCLARGGQLRGHWVALADGQRWLVPVARGLADSEDGGLAYYEALPRGLGLDEHGCWTQGSVQEQHRWLWEVACRWWDAISRAMEDADADEGGAAAFDFQDTCDSALAALGVNYRISKAEVVLLGLFTESSVAEVLNATVDMPTFRAWVKKKQG